MLRINKKIIRIIILFSIFLIAIPIIKNKTRLIEKKISNYKKQIIDLEKSLLEAQLEFHYLSSPEILSNKVKKYSYIDYTNMEYSQIYLNINQYLSQQKQTTEIKLNGNKEK